MSSIPLEGPTTHVVCAIIERNNLLLLAQRPAGKRLAGYWEFPGGKIEPGESPTDALHRELHEELGCSVIIHEVGPCVSHTYEWGNILLYPFRCRLRDESLEPSALEHAKLAWLSIKNLHQFDLAPADLPVLAWLLK
jgi:8-oxo-dGTP diphosphatase